MYIDFKVETWERLSFDDRLKDEILEKMKDGTIHSSNSLFEYLESNGESADYEVIPEAEVQLTVAENDNQSTIEVYDGHELVWQNGESHE